MLLKKQGILYEEMVRELSPPAALVCAHNDRMFEETGRVPTALVRTFGCQQNVNDGEKLKGMLGEMGYAFTEHVENADIILYNTCAVRENAEERVFGNVGALKRVKRQNPKLIIGLCGCMMQQEHIAAKIKNSYPYVDLVFGTHALERLPELLFQRLGGSRRVFDIENEDGHITEGIPLRREGAIKAGIPVMYGCNNFCSYCIVPFVRGRERSREPHAILEEARRLVDQGYKEITLLGQNVNSYGKTLDTPVSFSWLLRKLEDIPGEFLIRFMTSHPKDCTKELIDTIADCSKVANHIHLPVQSGSDRILAAMNRRYTRGEYLALIDYARSRIPGVTFTSDIIVGFPGEQEEDFAQTLALVKEVGYQSLFTFVYSKRKGTKAAALEDPVPKSEKMRWFQQLLDTQSAIGDSAYKDLTGRILRVLAEGSGKSGDGFLTGRTSENVIVEFPAPSDKIGRFVDVHITRSLHWAVAGELA